MHHGRSDTPGSHDVGGSDERLQRHSECNRPTQPGFRYSPEGRADDRPAPPAGVAESHGSWPDRRRRIGPGEAERERGEPRDTSGRGEGATGSGGPVGTRRSPRAGKTRDRVRAALPLAQASSSKPASATGAGRINKGLRSVVRTWPAKVLLGLAALGLALAIVEFARIDRGRRRCARTRPGRRVNGRAWAGPAAARAAGGLIPASRTPLRPAGLL